MNNRLQHRYENKKYFEILGIKPTQDLKIISKAFRMAALKYHPEKGGSHDEMVIIIDIMQKLRDKNYLQQYFQYAVTGEPFKENHFQFTTPFRTATSDDLKNHMDNIIRSMNEFGNKTSYNKLNDVLEQALFADPLADLNESAESPFEVSFHYKHTSHYGEIAIVIREELNDGQFREQHFQHSIIDGVFNDEIEKSTLFLARPENIQKKVGKLIQKINKDKINRHNKELFDKLNYWLDQQMAEYQERPQTGIELNYSKNTRRGMSQNWLNQITGNEKITQDSIYNVRGIAAGAMLYFFSPVSVTSTTMPSLPQPEYHREHFELDYFLFSLLTITSLAVIVAFLYYLCQPTKEIDSDNSKRQTTQYN